MRRGNTPETCKFWRVLGGFSRYGWLPKLDVAGSIPVSRSSSLNNLR
jgi:hypothetical protein